MRFVKIYTFEWICRVQVLCVVFNANKGDRNRCKKVKKWDSIFLLRFPLSTKVAYDNLTFSDFLTKMRNSAEDEN